MPVFFGLKEVELQLLFSSYSEEVEGSWKSPTGEFGKILLEVDFEGVHRGSLTGFKNPVLFLWEAK